MDSSKQANNQRDKGPGVHAIRKQNLGKKQDKPQTASLDSRVTIGCIGDFSTFPPSCLILLSLTHHSLSTRWLSV